MAQTPIIETITVNNTTYDLADKQARQNIADIPTIQSNITALQTLTQSLTDNKVSKGGDTMSGHLQMDNGYGLRLNRTNGSYTRVDAGDNTATIASYVSGGSSYRGVRIYSPSGQSIDAHGIEYFNGNKNYYVDMTRYTTFSGTSLTAESRTEYANGTAIASLSITWPSTHRGLIFGVNFTSASSFASAGVRHFNSSGTEFTPRYVGTNTNKASQRYNLICWYDGNYPWCAVSATNI